MEINLNYWGYLAVAAGVLLCFGPAVYVWLKEEWTESHRGRTRVDK